MKKTVGRKSQEKRPSQNIIHDNPLHDQENRTKLRGHNQIDRDKMMNDVDDGDARETKRMRKSSGSDEQLHEESIKQVERDGSGGIDELVNESDDVDEMDTMEEVVEESEAGAASSEALSARKKEMGIVEEIYCENFMCHQKLRVTMGRSINFITGENGSGKSAIIAALQVCLGASARTTHRGKSIKNLIRRDHTGNALVRITLLNSAKNGDSFRHEEFGDHIQVERIIRRDGGTSYKIKDFEGKVVSTKKADLDAMLDHLNIQIDNPCAILDQESAKMFLKGDGTSKYKFFLQSTDLFRMKNKYQQVKDQIVFVENNVVEKEKKKLEVLEKAYIHAKQKFEASHAVEHIKEKMTQVKNMLAWAYVHEHENVRHAAEAAVNANRRDLHQVTEAHGKQHGVLQNLTAKQEELNNQIVKLEEGILKEENEMNQLKQSLRDEKRPQVNKQEALRNAEKHFATLEQRLERSKKDRVDRVEEFNRKNQRGQDEMSKWVEEEKLTQSKMAELEHQRDTFESAKESKVAEMEQVEQQLTGCRQKLRSAEQEIRSLRLKLDSFRQQKHSRVAIFGSSLPKLQVLLEKNSKRFSTPPIGPIGLHVHLPEMHKDMAIAIELLLKNLLGSYIVANGRDKAVLDALKRDANCSAYEAGIIITSQTGSRYDDLKMPSGDLARYTVCNILQVENNVVFNTLVDIARIESKVIFPDRRSAEENCLQQKGALKQLASNVSEVFIYNGDKIQVRNGSVAYIPNGRQIRPSLGVRDLEDEVQSMQQRLEQGLNALTLYQRDESRLVAQHDLLKKEMLNHRAKVSAIDDEIDRMRNRAATLLKRISDHKESSELDTSFIDEGIAEISRERQDVQAMIQRLAEELREGNPRISELEEAIGLKRIHMERLQQDTQAIATDARDVMENLRRAQYEEAQKRREMDRLSNSLAKSEEQLATVSMELESSYEKAYEICGDQERVEVTEEPRVYMEQLRDLKRRLELEKERNDGLDPEQLELEMRERQTRLKQKKRDIAMINERVHLINDGLKARVKFFKTLRKKIASETGLLFNEIMGYRDFSGKVHFDHKGATLGLQVMKKTLNGSENGRVSDMKQLSGGERSFTQVALLLALGNSIECPFRVMDEFDVFMDSVNRDMTMELLIEAAKKKSRGQFIFITPNDLSSLKKDPQVKIQRMARPRYT